MPWFPKLDQPVSSLPYIGPSYALKLRKLSVFTVFDLLHHYPFRYDDLSLVTTIENLQAGETVTLTGHLTQLTNTYTRSGKTLQKGTFTDGTGNLEVIWFNQPYLSKTFSSNPIVSLSGKVSLFRGRPSLTSPQYELFHHPSSIIHHPSIHTGRLVPVYHETTGISSKWLRNRLAYLLQKINPIPDWLPPDLLKSHQLISLDRAIRQLHFPQNTQAQASGLARLRFDELLTFQLLTQIRRRDKIKFIAPVIQLNPEAKSRFLSALPFTLTASQIKAIAQIEADLIKPQPMNRLLQGDVGSGKTVVAAYALYLSALNHLPAIFMAPTEILIEQHYQTLLPIFKKLAIKLSLNTRSHKEALDDDQTLIHLGTHALIHRPPPQPPGVVVIDEQHKFGVAQRSAFSKSPNQPHFLSMTATPIPRTLCLTLYADTDVASLTDLPHPKLVKTRVVSEKKRPQAYQFIQAQIRQKGSQVFYVCPFIEDSETPELATVKATESVYQDLHQRVFPDLKLGLLHGRLTSAEKSAVITAFTQKKIDLLVATPIIEVGLDIPHASIIVIESGERFGLASLHQLRGRVGRRGQASYCLIFTHSPENSPPFTRLKHLETLNSGLALAEIDLQLRGPGDLYGTKQSGYINLKLASFLDLPLIQATHLAAQAILQSDPSILSSPYLKHRFDSLLEKQAEPR